MKQTTWKYGLVLGLMLAGSSSWAATTSCDAIMDKINAKLDRKGVHDYSLKVVPHTTETKLRVVGTCEGGKKKVIYHKEKASKKDAAGE